MHKIIDPNGIAREFVDEWHNDKDFVVAHTSGSTGSPKEIKLKKSDMLRSAKATCRYFGITDKSKLVLPLSTDYIAGKMMVVRSLASGSELIVEPPSAKPLSNNYGIVDLTAIVPSQIEGLLSTSTTVKQVIVGGGQISGQNEALLRQSRIHAFATYGMTETCSHVALRDISYGESHFKALDGITFSVDERQCLVINASDFSFRKVITNDIVELIDLKTFNWIGRADNVINSGGVKLHPELIESALSQFLPYDFYIVGRPSTRWGEEAILYVEIPQDKTPHFDKSDIIEKARSVLDRYSVPKEIVCVEKFQRTDSGKIKRILL